MASDSGVVDTVGVATLTGTRRAQLWKSASAISGILDVASKLLMFDGSTLRYRLQRILEISGHDLSDPDARFNLQLAAERMRTLSALRDHETS